MPRRSDPERILMAKLEGARALLENVEAGLVDRDVTGVRRRVIDLEQQLRAVASWAHPSPVETPGPFGGRAAER